MTLLGSYEQLKVLREPTRTAFGPAVPDVHVAAALGDGIWTSATLHIYTAIYDGNSTEVSLSWRP
jgi:hypothetical protein